MTDRAADAAAFERGSDAVPVVILVGEAGKDEKRIAQLVGQRAIIVLASTAEALRPLIGHPVRDDVGRSRLQVDQLCVDLAEHSVRWRDAALRLSEQEIQMLAVLAQDPGRAYAFAELASGRGGGRPADRDRVRSAVKRLRRKLRAEGARVRIQSVPGFGYRLTDGQPS